MDLRCNAKLEVSGFIHHTIDSWINTASLINIKKIIYQFHSYNREKRFEL